MRTKIYLLIFALFVTMTNIGAQNDTTSSHLEFMGIPITGKVSEVARKLQAKGFEFYTNTSNEALKGEFTGEDCIFLIRSTPKSKEVYSIAVFFTSEYKSWRLLKNKYTEYKRKLSEKYRFFDSLEKFYDPYYEGDGYELQALRNQKCVYNSYFKADGGTINLYTTDKNIMIVYDDEVGSDLNEKEENERDSDDL